MVKKLTVLYVLEPFLCRPEEWLHLAELARALGVPHPSLRQELNFLEEEGVLKKKTKGRLTMYLLNLDKPNIIDYLAIAEKGKLIRRCEHEPLLKELTGFLQTSLDERNKAVIFGSAAEARKWNDIDLLITDKADTELLEKFAEKVNVKLHLISVKELNDAGETLREEIVKKHLIIKGSEEVIRWLLLQA